MVNDPNSPVPGYPYRWELLDEEKDFDFENDVVLSTCEWKGRKLSIFDDFLQELEQSKEDDQ